MSNSLRLRFKPLPGRYALSYPLHSSQQLVTEINGEIQICLTVYDTHKLRMELLSYGTDVEVMTPPALREWLRATHQAAAGGPDRTG